MTATAPVQPQHHIWVARHKVWTTLLVLLVVALACGAILCNIHGSLMTAAGITALVALAVTVASLVWLHLQPTGLSPVRDPVSQYGITSFREGYRAATIAFAAAGLALAAGISQALGGRGLAVVILLVVFAIARVAINWFPMDPPGAKWTRTGWMHFVLAFVAFAAVLAAAEAFGAVLSNPGTWHELAPVSQALGYALTACLALFGLAQSVPPLRARFGAIERGFYLFAVTWCAVFAAACAAGVR
jgi:Protein of unknown function (DUF998)